MHHQDFSGDPIGTGGRKMSHPTAFHHRKGSSGASVSSTAAGGSSVVTGDENPSQAGSSSPGPHHQPQSQGAAAAAAAQVKKKSGFQITSVTSAQIHVSGNNSLADDTESYDDMDESHTEDLSSSDMLDVSASRAMDTGVPERSSSDETLNSLHGVETPGLASPNEPLQPHSIPQGSQQQSSMVNGVVHHHSGHPDNTGEAQLPPAITGVTPVITPLSSSGPAPVPKAGPRPGHSQRPQILDSSIPAGGEVKPLATTEALLPGTLNITAMPAGGAPGMPSSGFDSASAGGQGGSAVGGGPASAVHAPNVQPQHGQTPTAAPGSRFRVVKLDTNFEPFRKGRWTCTEYYEKDIPTAAVSEALRGADPVAEAELATHGPAAGPATLRAPQTLQPYQQPSQDFTSPQAMQSPPQGPAQVPPQEAGGEGVPMIQQATLPTAMPYGTDPQMGYPAPSGRQPDFIQPTAPFQTQVPHLNVGLPMAAVQGQASFTHTQSPQPQPHHPPQPLQLSSAAQGAPYMPLTALQADLQPLLTLAHGGAPAAGGVGPLRSSQLEDAQRLLLQHQGLLSLPRLASREGAAHMGMTAEANALMAAAGFRSQHAEEEEDSSSGASVVAIDNKIEQAMDLVKSHLMYAVREEVEVLKEQIKELIERNSQLELENNLLKNMASPEQMAQFQAQVQTGSPTGATQPPAPSQGQGSTALAPPSTQSSSTSA